MDIDPSKLSPDTRAALIRFGYAASRYHSGKFHKKEYISVGDTRVLTERIVPRSVQEDYLDARSALLESQDPDTELQKLLTQMDTRRLLDDLDGAPAAERTRAYKSMVELEKKLVRWCSSSLKAA